MQTKFEVCHIFKNFNTLIENILDIKIKQIQIDNGGEYGGST